MQRLPSSAEEGEARSAGVVLVKKLILLSQRLAAFIRRDLRQPWNVERFYLARLT